MYNQQSNTTFGGLRLPVFARTSRTGQSPERVPVVDEDDYYFQKSGSLGEVPTCPFSDDLPDVYGGRRADPGLSYSSTEESNSEYDYEDSFATHSTFNEDKVWPYRRGRQERSCPSRRSSKVFF